VPRRLPVIQSEASEDAEASARPRVHWILIGAGSCITVWALLAVVALPLGARLGAAVVRAQTRGVAGPPSSASALFAVVSAAPLLVSFFSAALLSGALVGRFGGRAGPREAALGGVSAGALTSLLSLRPGLGLPLYAMIAALAALSLLGATGGALGGIWGRRSRP